jgi:hypothetical protein
LFTARTSAEHVPDPEIEHPRDAIIKVTLRHLRLTCTLRRLHARHEERRHPGYETRGGRRGREAKGRWVGDASSSRSRSRAASAINAARQLLGLRALVRRDIAAKLFGHHGRLFGTRTDGAPAASEYSVPSLTRRTPVLKNGLSDEQLLFLSDIFPTGWQAAAVRHPA